MGEIQSILARVRELYIQNCNDTYTDEDREAMYTESAELLQQVDQIATDTEFNGIKLLDSSQDNIEILSGAEHWSYNDEGLKLQVSNTTYDSITITISDFRIYSNEWRAIGTDIFAQDTYYDRDDLSTYLTLEDFIREGNDTALERYLNPYDVDDATGETYQTLILATLDYSIEKVSEARSSLGAIQNRLEKTIAINENASENTQDAESKIRDTDMAEEMVKNSKESILMQVGESLISQSKSDAETVLKLLQ